MCVATTSTGVASGEEKLSDLKARMDQIQGDLNAVTAELENLHTRKEETGAEIRRIEQRTSLLERREARMRDDVIEAATILYKTGNAAPLEALFSAGSIGELANSIELLSRVSSRDQAVLIEFSRTQEELADLADQLDLKQDALAQDEARVAEASDRLLAQLDATGAEYEDLKAQIAAAQESSAPASSTPSSSTPAPSFSGDLACPVSGPVSFIDSWGAPRSGGRSHQGVDIMANYGQPVVAIVSGTITYAGYGDSAGNWLSLTGDNGHVYWYMHNQDLIRTNGHVEIGEQIATVGDTGNATGTPHLHFEYHPGGGGPINPYPLAAEACF